MQSSSIDLLPEQFLHKIINFSNKTLEKLMRLWVESLDCFLNDEWHKLDPLVCENACHTRALALYELSLKYKNKPNLQSIISIRNHISNLISAVQTTAPINPKTEKTIRAFLKDSQLYFYIPSSL